MKFNFQLLGNEKNKNFSGLEYLRSDGKSFWGFERGLSCLRVARMNGF